MPPYQTNPINDFYMRNAQMYQGQFRQPLPQQVNTRYVTSVDEARAAMIDCFSTNLFLDTGSGKIYLKRLNNDGRAEFITYCIEESDGANDSGPLSEINERLSNIENFLGGIKDGKPVSGDAGVQQSANISQSTAAGQDEPNGPAESAGFPKNAGNDKWQKRR